MKERWSRQLRGEFLPVLSSMLIILIGSPPAADAHGYMKTPRSRNLYAAEHTSWTSITAEDPAPEVCPQCCSARGNGCGIAGANDYDVPLSALGGLMKTNIQETYLQGQEIVVDVVLTAHHMGHFEFSAFPI